MYCTKKILDDLTWVGADDRRLVCFEGVYGVPDGVSYNSYLLIDEKTVLFDAVDKAVSRTFLENVSHTLNGRNLDYIFIHHMEPDHAASIGDVILRYPDAKIVCSDKAKTMLCQFFDGGFSDRVQVVKEGDTLVTGRHSFTFLMAPMVHWPEVMMSYDSADKILFSADAFGTFGALNGHIFADEVDFMGGWLDEARRYYTNIVGKYGPQVQAMLKKAAKLDISYVCPLHGFVWRSHFEEYLEKYRLWSSYTPEKKGVMLAYASVYGHTENTANILACKLVDRGVEVKMYDTSVAKSSYMVSDAFKYSHLVFASTTYNAGIFVTMENLLDDIVHHNLQDRAVAIIENGSWAPTSGKLMQDKLSVLRGTRFMTKPITIKSAPKESTLGALDELADAIAMDIMPPLPVFPEGDAPVAKPLIVDDNAMFKFSYGVEVLTTQVNGKDYGCIINTAGQVSSSQPRKVTISCIKKNNTCDMVAKAGKFNISILTEEAPFSLFQRFGFQSGRDVDKFADVPYDDRMSNGIRYIPQYTNAVLSCEVIGSFDLDTQVLYVANVVEAKVLSGGQSCTYAYYHSHIKPKKAPAADQPEGWVCTVCGYFYEGHELPKDFVCPICKHGPDAFQYVPAVTHEKKKGFICSVCGHFEPFDGDKLPDDYVCPVCHHGADVMEPAEQ